MWYLVKTMERRPGDRALTRVLVRLHKGDAESLNKNRQWEKWNAQHPDRLRVDCIVAEKDTVEEIRAEMRRYLVDVGMRVRR